MSKLRTVQLTKKDGPIIVWKDRIRENWDGGMNFLIKHAIRYYMKNKDFVCIGKIHCNADAFESFDKKTYFSLWLGDSPDIEAWLDSLSKNNLMPAKIIREIVRKSIKVVPSTEEEWIPSFLDFDVDVLSMIDVALSATNANTVTDKVPSVEKSPSNDSPPGGGVISSSNTNRPQKNHVEQIKTNTEKHQKPRALGLSGIRVNH